MADHETEVTKTETSSLLSSEKAETNNGRPLLTKKAIEIGHLVTSVGDIPTAVDWKTIFSILFDLFKTFGPCLMMLSRKMVYNRLKQPSGLRKLRIKDACTQHITDPKTLEYTKTCITDVCNNLTYEEFSQLLDESKKN